MKRMVSNGFWSILFSAVLALSTVSCGGGGGGGGGSQPQASTSSSKTVSGNVNSLSSLVASGAKTKKAIEGGKASIVPDASINITSFDKSDTKIDEVTISSGSAGSFAASIKMNDTGGYIVLEVTKDGFTSSSKRVDFDSPDEVNLSAELDAVNTVVSTVGTTLKASGEPMQAFTFGVIRYKDGTKKALSGSRLKAAKAVGGATTELELIIPADSVPAETTTLIGKIQTYDSSNPDDAANFPGAYMDSSGNKLVSLAFDYMNITDDNGQNLGSLVQGAKASGKLKKSQTDPTVITRWVPAGSCENLLRDVVCDETDATTGLCKKVKNDDGNTDGVFQVPVYTYNPRKGDWTLLGLGKLDTNNDGSSDAADAVDYTLAAPTTSPADHKDYQKYCKDNGGTYLRIEVTNEDFIASYWNLDYPLIFETPTEVCIEKTFVDSEGNKLAGLYASLYDDDYNPQSFSSVYKSTDSNGKVKLKTVLTANTDTDRTAILSYYNPFTYNYETETVTLGDSPACETKTNTLTKPKRCGLEGKVTDEAGTPKTNQYVWIYGSYPSYFYTWKYTDGSGNFSAETPCEQDLNVYTGYDWTEKARFNVNWKVDTDPSTTIEGESSDTNDKVVIDNIKLGNIAPYGYGYLSTYSIKAAGSATAWVYGYDYDGNYPLSYSITSTNGSWDNKTGTISSTEWWKEIAISGLTAGDYPLSLTVTDNLNKSSSAYPLGTLTVTAGNRPPVISYAYPSSNIVTANQALYLYGWGYDLDETTTNFPAYTWTIDEGSGPATVGTTPVSTYTIPSSAVGKTLTVGLTLTDSSSATDSRFFTVKYPCSYDLDSYSGSFTETAGTGTVSVSSGSSCTWGAASNASWITVTSGSSGSGNGTVEYSVEANTSAFSRSGTIAIAGKVFTVYQSGLSCQYTLSSSGNSATFGGGSGTVNVTASTGCTWTARSNAPWIMVTSGASGNGNGAVGYYVAANNTSTGRTGTISIADKTFTVTQSGVACSYSITPTSKSFGSTGGTGSISLSSPTGCSWEASTTDAWITVSSTSASGVGSGTVGYTVAANTDSAPRTGTVTVGGKPFTVYQAGKPCDYTVSAASQSSFTYTGGTGTISVTTSGTTCTWAATSSVSWITVSPSGSRTGSGDVTFTVAANSASSLPRTGTVTMAGNTISITQTGAPCEGSYSIAPTSNSFTSTGGTGTIALTSITGCSWTATTTDSWITITSGSSGTGSGSVGYSVAQNTGGATRTGTITAGGQTFTVTQAGASCTYSISPTSDSYTSTGGTGSIAVTSLAGCPWSASTTASWITITSGSGIGSGTASYSVAQNNSTSSRTGTISVAGKTFTITQSGASCSFSISSTSNTFTASAGTGSVSVTSPTGCSWTATSNAAWITITSGSTGNGNGTVAYSVTENTTGADRTGTMTIAGQTFTVTQGWSGTNIIIQ